jgi:hypothetical protein
VYYASEVVVRAMNKSRTEQNRTQTRAWVIPTAITISHAALNTSQTITTVVKFSKLRNSGKAITFADTVIPAARIAGWDK